MESDSSYDRDEETHSDYRGGEKRKIDLIYWITLPWPNIELNGGHSAQISKNLGHFLHF